MQRSFSRSSMNKNNKRRIGVFVMGMCVGALVSAFVIVAWQSLPHSKEIPFEDDGMPSDVEDKRNAKDIGVMKRRVEDEVMPTSFSVMDSSGCVCRSCEEALASAHDRLAELEDRVESCEKEATARDEEEFQRQDILQDLSGTRKDDAGQEGEEKAFEFEPQGIEVFVGIQSGVTFSGMDKTDYDYAMRRSTIRKTWLRSKNREFQKNLSKHGIVVKFVMGHALDAEHEKKLEREFRIHGDMLRLDLNETYANLAEKSHAYFKTVMRLYDPKYIVKVDDDVYFKLSRVPSLAQHWTSIGADYIGCMKTGEIQKDPNFKWFEPQSTLLGGESYFAHSWGSVYVLSGTAARAMLEIDKDNLRFFANEDVTVGAWMLALNMEHYDDRRLCVAACGTGGVAVMDIPHPGLLHVKKRMLQLDSTVDCREDDFSQHVQAIPPYMDFSIKTA